MARLGRWLSAVIRWLGEAGLAWLALATAIIALSISFHSGARELHIRLTGLALQWLGVGTVAIGIRQTRRLFGRPGLLQLWRAWFNRFPSWHRREVLLAASGKISLSGSAKLEVWSPVDSGASADEQLKLVVRNVERLRERVTLIESDLETRSRNYFRALKQEEQARAAGDQEVGSRLEAAHTGGLHISFVGLLWLFLGLLLATLSRELADLVAVTPN